MLSSLVLEFAWAISRAWIQVVFQVNFERNYSLRHIAILINYLLCFFDESILCRLLIQIVVQVFGLTGFILDCIFKFVASLLLLDNNVLWLFIVRTHLGLIREWALLLNSHLISWLVFELTLLCSPALPFLVELLLQLLVLFMLALFPGIRTRFKAFLLHQLLIF